MPVGSQVEERPHQNCAARRIVAGNVPEQVHGSVSISFIVAGHPPEQRRGSVDHAEIGWLYRHVPGRVVVLVLIVDDHGNDELPVRRKRVGVLAHDVEHHVPQMEADRWATDQGPNRRPVAFTVDTTFE
jgi:hypothetical protein